MQTCWAKLPVSLLLAHNFWITLLVILAYHILSTLCTLPVLSVLYILLQLDPHLEMQGGQGLPVPGLPSQISMAVLIECLVVGLTTIQGTSVQMGLCIYPGLLLDTMELLQLGVLVAQVSW